MRNYTVLRKRLTLLGLPKRAWKKYARAQMCQRGIGVWLANTIAFSTKSISKQYDVTLTTHIVERALCAIKLSMPFIANIRNQLPVLANAQRSSRLHVRITIMEDRLI